MKLPFVSVNKNLAALVIYNETTIANYGHGSPGTKCSPEDEALGNCIGFAVEH